MHVPALQAVNGDRHPWCCFGDLSLPAAPGNPLCSSTRQRWDSALGRIYRARARLSLRGSCGAAPSLPLALRRWLLGEEERRGQRCPGHLYAERGARKRGCMHAYVKQPKRCWIKLGCEEMEASIFCTGEFVGCLPSLLPQDGERVPEIK